ncbi:MAG: O-antigen ligase family protein [Candidatus Thiodiazotropha endolucinida]
MIIFGTNVHSRHLPLWFLTFAIPAIPFIQESYPVFSTSLTVRLLTMGCMFLYIVLSIPELYRTVELKISTKVLALVIAFIIISGLSTLLSDIPWQGSVRWAEVSTCLVSGIILYHQLSKTPVFKDILAFSLMISMSLIILFYLFSWITVYDPVNHNWVSNIPFATNIRHIGYIAAITLPLAFTHIDNQDIRKRLFTLFYLTCSWGFVFWMGGRATFLAVTIVTLVFFWLRPKLILISMTTIIAGLFLSQIFSVSAPELNLIHLLDYDITEQTLNQVSSNRITMYEQVLIRWWNGAPLLGLGSDAYRYLRPAILDDNFVQPHSVILQVTLSYGLVGLLIFLALSLKMLNGWLKTIQSHPIPGLPLAALSASMVALVDGVFYHSISLLYASIVLTLTIPATSAKVRPLGLLFTLSSQLPLAIFFYAILSIQIYAAATPPSEQKIKFIRQQPVYVNPSLWISLTSMKNKAQTVEYARLAVKYSENPCFYILYLPLSEQAPFEWCAQKGP